MMSIIGKILFYAGCIAASFIAVKDVRDADGKKIDRVDWMLYAPYLAVGIAGVVLIRLSAKGKHAEQHFAQLQSVEESLARIVANIRTMDDRHTSLSLGTLSAEIDDCFRDDITTFVDARKSIASAYSLDAYADVMNSFASAERYLNRVWCAAVDGYEREALEYLHRSREQFEAAHDKLMALKVA